MKRIPMRSFQSVWTERESSLLRRCCVRLGIGSNQEIIDIFGEEPRLLKTLEKDTTTNYEEGLKEIYKKLRPGRTSYSGECSSPCLIRCFSMPKRYDLAKVGRYKYNKKLGLSNQTLPAWW